jgi:acetolactate synthase-1/2/3 large subunit
VGEADVVLAVGTRLYFEHTMWGVDDDLAIVAVNADAEEPSKHRKPAVELIGDAAPILRRLIDALLGPEQEAHIAQRGDARAPDALGGQARRAQAAACDPRRIRAELPDDGIFVDEVTQIGFAARLALPVYRPRTFLSPGYQDNLGWGYATGIRRAGRAARRAGAVDQRRWRLHVHGERVSTAVRHRIPLVAIVFADGSFGNVRRIQEENYGNRLIASDLANPDFVKFAEAFGRAGERVAHARMNCAARSGAALRGATVRP